MIQCEKSKVAETMEEKKTYANDDHPYECDMRVEMGQPGNGPSNLTQDRQMGIEYGNQKQADYEKKDKEGSVVVDPTDEKPDFEVKV